MTRRFIKGRNRVFARNPFSWIKGDRVVLQVVGDLEASEISDIIEVSEIQNKVAIHNDANFSTIQVFSTNELRQRISRLRRRGYTITIDSRDKTKVVAIRGVNNGGPGKGK